MWPFRKRNNFDKAAELASAVKASADEYEQRYQPLRNISEPVRAIAQAMRERPGSFRIIESSPRFGAQSWRITDRQTGLRSWCFKMSLPGVIDKQIHLPFDLTHDETEYLWSEGEKWLAERRQRTKDYINAKRRREWSRKYGVEV